MIDVHDNDALWGLWESRGRNRGHERQRSSARFPQGHSAPSGYGVRSARAVADRRGTPAARRGRVRLLVEPPSLVRDVEHRHCQVDEKLVDRPLRYWAPARREPAMLGIKNGRQFQLDNTARGQQLILRCGGTDVARQDTPPEPVKEFEAGHSRDPSNIRLLFACRRARRVRSRLPAPPPSPDGARTPGSLRDSPRFYRGFQSDFGGGGRGSGQRDAS